MGFFRFCICPVVVISTTLFVLGCSNFFKEPAKKDFDAAYIFEAKKYLNSQSWDSALEELGKVSTAGKADRGYKSLLASVYAGKCGLNLISLANTISQGGGSFFQLLLLAFKSASATNLTACQTAESTLVGISASASLRTGDENVLLAMVEWAKIGALLASNASVDADNDGIADGALGGCVPQLSNAEKDAIGFGLTVSLASLTAAAVPVGSASTILQTACSQAGAIPQLASFCNKLNPLADTFDANERKFIAWIVRSSDTGIGFLECAADPLGSTPCAATCAIP